jgi:hypothetical protein
MLGLVGWPCAEYCTFDEGAAAGPDWPNPNVAHKRHTAERMEVRFIIEALAFAKTGYYKPTPAVDQANPVARNRIDKLWRPPETI